MACEKWMRKDEPSQGHGQNAVAMTWARVNSALLPLAQLWWWREDSRESDEVELTRFNCPLTTSMRRDSMNGWMAGMQRIKQKENIILNI